MLSTVNKKAQNKRQTSANFKEAPYDNEDLKKYRAAPVVEPVSAFSQSRQGQVKKFNAEHFDHHAEILAAKKEVELQERASALDSDRSKKKTQDGLAEDQEFKDEFHDIRRGLTNHHPYRGELKVGGNKYQMGADDEEMDLA